MDEPLHTASAGVAVASSADADALITALQAAGAGRFDPVGQYYLETLAKRASKHPGRVGHLLELKLNSAIAVFSGRFEQAQSEARIAVIDTVVAYPHLADKLQIFFAASDFNGLKQCIQDGKAGNQPTALGELVRQLEPHAGATVAHHPGALAKSFRTELKTVRSARNVWSTLSASRQVTRALEQAPKNAGPINSHMLVLRSLVLMRDISPSYLNRFMSYADTLLSLDQGEKEKPATPKKSSPARAAKK